MVRVCARLPPAAPNRRDVLGALDWVARCTRPVYFEKIRVFKAGYDAWIAAHGMMEQDLGSILLVFGSRGND